MLDMSGIELLRSLRAANDLVPVILITAFPEVHVRREAEMGGAVGFLIKPFTEEAIVACIEIALRSAP